MKPYLILYHKNCFDGFCGAWAARKKFGNRADYKAVEYRALPKIKDLKNRKEIFLIDFCYHRPQFEKLLAANPNITIIDHHISLVEEMKDYKKFYYSADHSGAVAAWRYFWPGKPTPRLLRHIEDIDLWKFKMPFTREALLTLEIHSGFDFKKFNKMVADFENPQKRKKYINDGKLILKYRDEILKDIAGGAEKAKLENKTFYVVNSPIWRSEIGNWIVKNRKAPAIIWARKAGKINVSLRSDGKFDVSKIGVKYGGGGHKAASGFRLDADKPLPWRK